MRVLVLQHLAVEHPGVFRDFMRRDGITWDTIELDAGDKIPDLERYDLMMVMGGPQDVWQEDQYPWLDAEKAAIREFVVDMQRPYFGICLGHQLLASAIGGDVGLSAAPEVGIQTVERTFAGQSDAIMSSLADPMTVLQWHGAEVKSLPQGTTVLARSNGCAVQAFRYSDHAYGLQYHVEITSATVADWAAIPEYKAALEKTLGANALPSLDAGVSDRLTGFNNDAEKIYNGLKAMIARHSAAAPAHS